MTHSLLLTAQSRDNQWSMNATWASRGNEVDLRFREWSAGRVSKPTIVMGHSSGGAYGAYVAFMEDYDINYLTTLVTFGAPIWGTPSMENRYRTHFTQGDRIQTGVLRPQVIEFGAPNDPVPTLPPPWAAIDLLIPGYAQANRPTYARFTSLILLGLNNGPTPVDQPATLPAVTNAVLHLVTGQGIVQEHGMPNYTAGAARWANNDVTIGELHLETERRVLLGILADMNAAGVGA
jgi:hypothetical protein